MAKAVRAAPGRGSRPPLSPRSPMARAGVDRRQGLVEYFRGVWAELKIVTWPTRDELLRMTGIVVVTVLLFAVLIGGADYLLGLGVNQVYKANGTSTAQTTPTPTPATAPTTPTP